MQRIVFKEIKRAIYLIILFLSFLSTILAFIFFFISIKIGLTNPLISILFPNDLFYNFLIKVDIQYVLIVLVLNLTTVYLSSLIAIKAIGRKKIIEVLRS